MTNRKTEKKIILAIPKGRILKELTPILNKVDIIPEKEFFDLNSRKILFSSNKKLIDFIKVRSFDVVNFVAYGGAHIGIVGLDVIEEFNYEEIYSPVNLGNNNETSISLIAKKIKKKANSRSKIIFMNKPIDDPYVRRPDIKKAYKLINWKPLIKLDQGLDKTLKYFRSINDLKV